MREDILYREVEDLRAELYLGHFSPVYQTYRTVKDLVTDVLSLFGRKKAKKKDTLHELMRQKRLLLGLADSPYAYFIQFARSVKRIVTRPRFPPSAPPQKKKKAVKTVLIWGAAPFAKTQERSVQIALALSQKCQVIYIQPVFQTAQKPGFEIVKISPMLTLVTLKTKKRVNVTYEALSSQQSTFLARSLKLLNLKILKPYNFITYIHHPFWYPLIPRSTKKILYDYATNYAVGKHAGRHIISAEKKLLKKAATVTTPLPFAKRTHTSYITLKNGVDMKVFADASKTRETCDVGLCWIKKPVIGYIGTLDERIDEQLLGVIARSNPSASVVLVGNTNYRPVIAVAETYDNIYPVGEQDYHKLSLYLQSFDILIVPYKRLPMAVTTFPELPLYLASGKPIILTWPHTTAAVVWPQLCKLVYRAGTHADWAIQIQEALKEKKRSRKKYQRIALAKKLSWNVKPLLRGL